MIKRKFLFKEIYIYLPAEEKDSLRWLKIQERKETRWNSLSMDTE